MAYRCLIIDDEPIALDILRSFLDKLDHFEVAGAFQDPLEAFQALQKQPADLLFLDIQMPELSGLDLLRALQRPPAVILTTAHREFALEGFELDVVDYLLKPIAFDRFLRAIDKFLDRRRAVPSGTSEAPPDHLFVRADRKSVRIAFDDLLYIEGLKDYVRIITPAGQLLTKESIGQMEERLPAEHFIRIHRSYLVPAAKVSAFTHTEVEIGDRQLPVGRAYRQAFMKFMERHTQL